MLSQDYTPKLFSLLKQGIPPQQLKKDILSGIVVGIVALPLAIAFAMASGVSPEKGIITAILAGFIISFFGGSRVQIGGPTGAFVVIISSIIGTYGFNGLLVATFMAGIILVAMGLFKLGSLLKFIPQTLIIGFTTGIALIIFSIQIKDFLGLSIAQVPADFIGKWGAYFHHLSGINLWALAVGVVTILMITLLPLISRKVPWTFVTLVVVTLLVYAFKIPVATISTSYGDLRAVFPAPAFFQLDWDIIRKLLSPAFTIAILAALESLLSAVVADGMIGGHHRSNVELIAQGLANMVSPLFGGIPATGAIARTATNVNQGGRTPIAGIVHALTLLLIFFAAMPVVKFIPLSVLAGVLMVVAWKMSEIPVFIRTCRINIFETTVLLTTFLLTVFVDLTVAIPVGFILAILLFMKRMSDAVDINPLLTVKNGEDKLFNEEVGEYSRHIVIFELNGPLFFGAMHHLLTILPRLESAHRTVILRFRYVPILDASGLARLKEFSRELTSRNMTLLISGAQPRVAGKMLKFGIVTAEALHPDIRSAIDEAEKKENNLS